jgi:hypothetical protein
MAESLWVQTLVLETIFHASFNRIKSIAAKIVESGIVACAAMAEWNLRPVGLKHPAAL